MRVTIQVFSNKIKQQQQQKANYPKNKNNSTKIEHFLAFRRKAKIIIGQKIILSRTCLVDGSEIGAGSLANVRMCMLAAETGELCFHLLTRLCWMSQA